MDWAKTAARRDEKHLVSGFGATYIRYLKVYSFRVIVVPDELDNCWNHHSSGKAKLFHFFILAWLYGLALNSKTIPTSDRKMKLQL